MVHVRDRIKIGDKFSRLTVVGIGEISNVYSCVDCVCDCGNFKKVKISYLFYQNTKSCGCLQKPHGMSNSSEFSSWTSMKKRCYGASNNSQRYRGRGIKVCDRWLESFENFYADMGPKPSPKHSIDRINNDGNYEPSNCRWATFIEQNSNRCTNRKIEVGNEELTISEAARNSGIDKHTIRERLNRGWSAEDAVKTEVRKKLNFLYLGVEKTLTEICRIEGKKYWRVRKRMNAGMSLDEALK